jgi:hypothetical protein
MTPFYVHIETRRPSRDGEDPGAIEEAWAVEVDGKVHLCTQDGTLLHGDGNKRKLEPNETARECAARLLRSKSMHRASKPFNRPLRYPKIGMA